MNLEFLHLKLKYRYQNKVEALHVLFMLYLELKNQTHRTSLSTYWFNT